MQSRIPRKLSSDAARANSSFGWRYASLCAVCITGVLAIVNAADGQDAAANAPTLRPSFQACVEASKGVTLALNNCIGAEHAFQDKRLNAAYQQLRKSLPKSERVRLRDEERAWITQRDKECAPQADSGTAGVLDANQCQLDETAARAAVLEVRMGH
ncbi:MAG: lysozyme inhibitor LprI family protein [Pseudomonadota bacterium]